jgi:protein-S-isoprenylcysteine O-methyltransferase Ste14
MIYSLTLLTILLLLIRIYYFKLSETVNLNHNLHELLINIFGASTIICGLLHTKPIQTLSEIYGSIIFVFGLYLLYLTHSEMLNSFSPIIDYNPNRKLINTGIFGIVRHPMYTSGIILNISILIIIENIWIKFICTIFCILLLCRIPTEEYYLKKQFPEYNDVMPKYKIVPFVY